MTEQTKYTLYLDSSGDPGWPSPWGRSPQKLYIIGGIVLNPKSEADASTELKLIIDKHFENIQKPQELKYTYIIQGKKIPFRLLDDQKRKRLADDVFLLINRLRPKIFCTIVDKEKLKTRYGTNAFNPKIYSIQATLARFSMTLKREVSFGEVIMDDEEAIKDKYLQNYIAEKRKYGAIMRGQHYNPVATERLEPIINSLLFSESQDSAGIQLADFVVKAVWNKYLYGKDRRFLEIKNLFDNYKGRQYEPCLLPD